MWAKFGVGCGPLTTYHALLTQKEVLMNNERHHIVIGAGVIGVCVAYFLAKRGARVSVLEKDEVGKGASYGNAGAIALGHSPLNKPGRVKQAFKSIFDPLSPLYVAPRVDPDLLRWFWTFRKYCGEERLQSAMKLLGELGHPTGELFDLLVQDEDIDCAYSPGGYYEIYKTKAGLTGAKKEAAMTALHGYHPETLSGEALRDIEPAIRDDIIGGVYFKDSATIDPYRFVAGLAEVCRTSDVDIKEHCGVGQVLAAGGTVKGVRLTNGEVLEADTVTVAAGAHSRALAKHLGIPLPMQAAKGYSTDRDLASAKVPKLGITFMLGERSVYCTPMGSFLRLAGTLEFSGLNHDMREPRLSQLTKSAIQYVAGMERVGTGSEWCGLRPCLPDGYPAVGPVPGIAGLFFATGHAMLGLTLGPITGRLVAEMILDGKPSIDIGEFGVERFA